MSDYFKQVRTADSDVAEKHQHTAVDKPLVFMFNYI